MYPNLIAINNFRWCDCSLWMARMHFPDEGAGGKCNKEFWSKWIPRRVKHNAFVMSLWACVWLLGTYPLGRPLSEGWRFMFLGMDHPKDVGLLLTSTNQRWNITYQYCTAKELSLVWENVRVFIFFDCEKNKMYYTLIILYTKHNSCKINEGSPCPSLLALVSVPPGCSSQISLTLFLGTSSWHRRRLVSSWGTMHMKPESCKSPSSVPNIDDVIFFNLVFDFFSPFVLWDFLVWTQDPGRTWPVLHSVMALVLGGKHRWNELLILRLNKSINFFGEAVNTLQTHEEWRRFKAFMVMSLLLLHSKVSKMFIYTKYFFSWSCFVCLFLTLF